MKNLSLKMLPLVMLFPFMVKGQWITSGSNIYNSNTGNIGIGTTSPETKLHVNGVIKSSFLSLSENSTTIGFLGRGLPTTSGWTQTPDVLALTYMGRDFVIGGWSKSTTTWKGAAFYINSDDGNIGIGTTLPKEKLSVNGKIRAHEIKVETANWPDYVFARDYKLPSLQETENHIKQNGHLSDIPSALEVKANGLDLGEMNAKLLKKIEELTLYLIDLDKKVDNLGNENKELKDLLLRSEIIKKIK